MNILLFGESCTGKSTIASILGKEMNMKVYTGKDYFKLSKNKPEAISLFKELLNSEDENIVFVATEKEEVSLAPESMSKVLFKASLSTKKERFAIRFRGTLPKPVEQMIEKKHGMFDDYNYDLVIEEKQSIEETVTTVISFIENC